jgi:glycosyltransferase involved in cell wall biosynthesis
VTAKDLRIFIGPKEVGKIGGLVAEAIRAKGIRVHVVQTDASPFRAGIRYDEAIRISGKSIAYRVAVRLRMFFAAFSGHNAFLFLYGNTLLPHNADLPLLRLFRKKTIMWFLGSDISSFVDIERERRQLGIRYDRRETGGRNPFLAKQKKIRMIRRVERCVDHIITGPTIAHLLRREYIGMNPETAIRMPVDVCNIRYHNVQNPKPIIVHAPTNEKIKGTAHIEEAVRRLKEEEFDFDFIVCKGMPNTRVRKILEGADIAVDQLFSAKGGLFAIEAMAAGCAVLGGNIPQLSRIPDLPILHTDTKNIQNNLKLVIENPDLRRELGKRGRDYVEKYHDHVKIAGEIVDLFLCRPASRSSRTRCP